MKKKQPVFDYSACISCSICVQACPFSCLSLSLEGRQGKYKNLFPQSVKDCCTGCGICADSCPMDCIQMKDIPHES